MSKGLVSLRHTVDVVFLLNRAAAEVCRVEQLVRQLVGHALFGAGPRVADNPAERQRRAPVLRNFDRNLVPFPDTRPGKDGKWHKTIRTSVDLKVEVGDGSTLEVTGYALFYLTRGDSAAIPAELKARGFKPDSLRWWIDRWEDETIDSGLRSGDLRRARPAAGAATIIIPVKMAELKRRYR